MRSAARHAVSVPNAARTVHNRQREVRNVAAHGGGASRCQAPPRCGYRGGTDGWSDHCLGGNRRPRHCAAGTGALFLARKKKSIHAHTKLLLEHARAAGLARITLTERGSETTTPAWVVQIVATFQAHCLLEMRGWRRIAALWVHGSYGTQLHIHTDLCVTMSHDVRVVMPPAPTSAPAPGSLRYALPSGTLCVQVVDDAAEGIDAFADSATLACYWQAKWGVGLERNERSVRVAMPGGTQLTYPLSQLLTQPVRFKAVRDDADRCAVRRLHERMLRDLGAKAPAAAHEE